MESTLEIEEWIESIDKTMYDEIVVDGTEENYINFIKPKIIKYEELLKEFDEKFKLITPEIYNRYRQQLSISIYTNIDKAIDISEQISMKELSILYKSIYKNLKPFELDFQLDTKLIDIINFVRKTLKEQIKYWINPINMTNKTIETIQLFYDV